ncbi:MAG: hypothetical protein IJ335_04530 [Lachnospiraceae bacterium]|nr:hypothetical protein [Lachnospiraceae bacterium]
MDNRENSKIELRQEILELEKELEEKKLSCKPVLVISNDGPKEHMGSYELRKEIARLEKEIEGRKNLLAVFESDLMDRQEPLPAFDKNAILLPEYREGGYFTSQDFYDKCDEFHKMLEEQGLDFRSMGRADYIFRKKKFLQEKYGITWLVEEYQFLPGTVTNVHISHPND